jgi:hypothetical protein
MRRVLAIACFAATLGITGIPSAHAGAPNSPDFKVLPNGKGGYSVIPSIDAGPIIPGPSGIEYNGGPIMPGTPGIWLIFYGPNWTDAQRNILLNFAQHLGSSQPFMVNSTYFDNIPPNPNRYVTGSLSFRGSVNDANSQNQGANPLTDAQIKAIVDNAITNLGIGPADANNIYFVLTDNTIDEVDLAAPKTTMRLCTNYCGWHNHGDHGGTDIKYAFIGDAAFCANAPHNLTNCIGLNNTVNSPNNSIGPDAMANTFFHEASETVSDPDLNAWFVSRKPPCPQPTPPNPANICGQENGDLCNFTFGTVKAVGNGSSYNVQIGSLRYLIQQMWLNARGGLCSLTK